MRYYAGDGDVRQIPQDMRLGGGGYACVFA